MSTNYVGASPGATAVTVTPTAVASTGDTVDGTEIINGAVLVVQTVGTSTALTFTDPGHTPAGTLAGTVAAVSIGTNTTKVFGKTQLQGFIDPATNKVTLAFSATTAVTAFVVY